MEEVDEEADLVENYEQVFVDTLGFESVRKSSKGTFVCALFCSALHHKHLLYL